MNNQGLSCKLNRPTSLRADLNLQFDPAVLAFANATFGDPVCGDQLDLFNFGSVKGISPAVDSAAVFQLSLDSPLALNAPQEPGFTMATVTFTALGNGTSSLNLEVAALVDAEGAPLGAATNGGSIRIVPEPSAALLAPVHAP